ncbi:sensor domain-containing protein [Streptomyces actinomycinicus]|uniref:histidine kinase n=1 Tax=Streptomyces actinomycinicus TaxID=1695166 RepID=A0A937EDU6_9ACTN|nr:sensor histidine kinase [Streptomyces actinomycinicus]MBL1081112.1 sensor domain-containing protein [Streptomyces actinomycinicus]
MDTDTKRDGFRATAREALLAGVQGLVLAVVVLPCGVAFFALTLISLALIPVGIGLVTTPAVLTGVRALADARRRLAAQWCGIRIPAVYRPLPPGANPWTRTAALLRDPQVRRDVLWLPVDMTAGFFTALAPAVLVFFPIQGFLVAAGLWRANVRGPGDVYWYAFVPVTGQVSALGAAALGAVILAVGRRRTPSLLAAHFRLARTVIGAPDAALAERVRVLTETRQDAVDTSAAELRRIERDLHDGAQARLVAMGMDLGTIEMLVEQDPAQAKKLIAQARRNSAEALEELRDLVRGIHPPVLAERGLGDAVRALALRLPLPAEVTVELPGRADAPVESAAYFAVTEVLTNAVKHSGADRIWADVHHTGGRLRITVTDNGRGGAVTGAGSGLAGVERRLGTFDGVLAVSSPAGGPTMVTMEIPCVLS